MKETDSQAKEELMSVFQTENVSKPNNRVRVEHSVTRVRGYVVSAVWVSNTR